MTANGYTSNPPSGGGGGGPIAISDVTGLTAALADRATDAELTTGLAGKAATLHTHAESDVTALVTDLALKAPLASPTFTGTVSGVTASMVGLGNVNNTSDANKPVSTAQQLALDLKADLASPALTGNPTAPTQTAGNNSTRVATTAFVTAAVAGGGGGGPAMTVKRAVVTSGDITPQNTSGSWAALTGGPTLVIAAAVGDYISAEVMGGMQNPNSNTFYELAVLAGASLVRYGSSGTGTPSVEGDPAMYPDLTLIPIGGPILDFVAESGDINGGNVTIAIAVKSAGSGKFYASASFPFRWRVINHGAVTVS